jgi:adenine-specific DNA-methyltransferase
VLASVTDYVVWYARDISAVKYRQPYIRKAATGEGGGQYRWIEDASFQPRSLTTSESDDVEKLVEGGARLLRPDNLVSAGYSAALSAPIDYNGRSFDLPANSHWKTTTSGLKSLVKASRVIPIGKRLYYKRYIDDFGVFPLTNI